MKKLEILVTQIFHEYVKEDNLEREMDQSYLKKTSLEEQFDRLEKIRKD